MKPRKASASSRAKVSEIRAMIEASNLHAAAAYLNSQKFIASDASYEQRSLAYLKLKVFNRLQWLVEAAPIANYLLDQPNLNSEESLEVALFYVLTAQLESAERFMRQAIAQNTHSVLLASELAILFEQQGKGDKALGLYNRILASQLGAKKIDAVGARVLTRVTGLRRLDKLEIAEVVALCKKYIDDELEVRLLFGLAKAYVKIGDTEKEIICLKKANEKADRSNEAQPQAQTNESSCMRLKAIQTLFDVPEPDWMPKYLVSDKAPVFILGMPRSGTTLLEQILGAHSHVGNSGESRAMGIAFQRQLKGKALLPEDQGTSLPFFRYKTLNLEDSKAIINYYDQYQSLFSEKQIITDKEMSNIDRVGLILKLYPNAKFIYIQRHPLDVCASIMQHDFSQAYFSASSLKIVQEYETYYDKVQHWQKLFPKAVFKIEYESLVSEFEKSARALLKFLGLPWEESIKLFYKRSNSVRTPSLSQVRSGINANSINKWQRYHELIQPAERYLASRGFLPQS